MQLLTINTTSYSIRNKFQDYSNHNGLLAETKS